MTLSCEIVLPEREGDKSGLELAGAGFVNGPFGASWAVRGLRLLGTVGEGTSPRARNHQNQEIREQSDTYNH